MSCRFQAVGQSDISFRAFVIDMGEGRGICYEDREITDMQQMSSDALERAAKDEPSYTVGWEFNGQVELSGLPEGEYGIVVKVYRGDMCIDEVLPKETFSYTPRPMETDSRDDIHIEQDGLYAIGMDDWSDKTFSVAKNYGIPITGFLYMDDSQTLESISVTIYEGNEPLTAISFKPNKITWNENRASGMDIRDLLENTYGISVAKKYCGGLAFLVPSNKSDIRKLSDGSHQVEITITFNGGGTVDHFERTIVTVQDAAENPNAEEVRDIKTFVNENVY